MPHTGTFGSGVIYHEQALIDLTASHLLDAMLWVTVHQPYQACSVMPVLNVVHSVAEKAGPDGLLCPVEFAGALKDCFHEADQQLLHWLKSRSSAYSICIQHTHAVNPILYQTGSLKHQRCCAATCTDAVVASYHQVILIFKYDVACTEATVLGACEPEQFFLLMWYALQPASQHICTRRPPHTQTANDIALGSQQVLYPPCHLAWAIHSTPRRQHLKGNIWKHVLLGEPNLAAHPLLEGLCITRTVCACLRVLS